MGSVTRAGVTENAVIGMTIKLVALCAVPPVVVTIMVPVVAVGGTVAMSVVLVAEITEAETPANLTWLLAGTGSKFCPVTVTFVPALPDVGVKLLIVGGGCVITVKLVALVAVPPLVVTVIGPVVAPPGTSAVRLVADVAVTVARTPLNFTSFLLATGSKFVPVIVTAVPTVPLSGVKLVMDGAATV